MNNEKSKFTWGHGIIVAIISFMAFIVGLVVYFTSTMKNSELITDNYYQEELMFQSVIDAKNRAEKLTQKPEVKIHTEGLIIHFPKDINNQNAIFKFFLFRTDDKNLDIKRDFKLNDDTYIISSKDLIKGGYTLKLMWKKDYQDYQVDYDIVWK